MQTETQIVLVLSQHRDARPVVSGWPGPQWGKGWHGYCSCGWRGSPRGKDDAAKAQAQLDTDYHVASVLLPVLS